MGLSLLLRSASSNNARDEENVSKKRKINAPKTKPTAEVRSRLRLQSPVYVLEERDNWVEGMLKKNNSIRCECDRSRQSCSGVVTTVSNQMIYNPTILSFSRRFSRFLTK